MKENKAKRVLHVLSGLHTGGVQSFVMNYYRAIDKNKIQFDFVVMDKNEGNLEKEAISLGARIFRLRNIEDDRRGFLQDLERVLKEHQEIFAIHTHLNFLNYYILKIAKKCHIKKRVSHSHSNYPASTLLVNIARIFLRVGIRNYSTKLAACSNSAGLWLYGKCGIKSKKFELIYNAIDYNPYLHALRERDKLRQKMGLLNTTVFIHVGSISLVKNQSFLVDLMDFFTQHNKKKKLLLIGDGKLRSVIEKQIRDKGLQNDVVLFGNRNDVWDYLAASDCFLLPSIFEGLPISLIEAQFSGLPCVISNFVSDEAILSGSLVYKLPLDVRKWYEKINTIDIKTTEMREREGQQLIGSNYDIVKQCKRLEQLYEDN